MLSRFQFLKLYNYDDIEDLVRGCFSLANRFEASLYSVMLTAVITYSDINNVDLLGAYRIFQTIASL